MNVPISFANANPNQSAVINDLIPQIIVSIENNKLITFKQLLAQSAIMIKPSVFSFILLWCFNNYKNKEIYISRYISFLLTYGADPNINIMQNSNGNSKDSLLIKTPLIFAIEHNDIPLLNILLEHKVNVNAKDHLGRTALYYLKGNKNDNEIIEAFKLKGLNINEEDNEGLTAPMYYISENKEKTLCALIFIFNVDLFYKNQNGVSLLEFLIDKWSIKNEGKYVFAFIREKIISNLIGNTSAAKSTSAMSSKCTDKKLGELMFEKEDYIFKIKNESNNKDMFIEINPQPSVIISATTAYDSKHQKEKLFNLEQKKNFKNAYFSMLREINKKIQEQSIFYQNEIIKVKTLIEQKKQKLSQLNQKLNSFSCQEYYVIYDKYRDLSSKLSTFKEQQNLAENFYVLNDYQNLKYIRKDENKQEYITKQLQIDLLDFKEHVAIQIQKTKTEVNDLTNLIKQFVKDSLGCDYDITVYGSRATKLCLPTSDIDIVVTCPNFTGYSPLYTLYSYILQQNVFSNVNFIGKTQVPLIKIHSSQKYKNINVDVSLEDPNHYGVKCCAFVIEMLEKYEILMPMTLAVKNILQKAKLYDPYRGGLSSYGVILLIIKFLNMEKSMGVDISVNNLGNIFYSFLFYYGNKFDPHTIINIDDDYTDINKVDISLYNQYMTQLRNGELVIVDPLNRNNNVGKNTRLFQVIKMAFIIAYHSAKEPCECGCHFQYGEFCIKEDKVNHCILRRIFNSVKRFSSD